jgi:maltooligosyltrehalose trehalohydrolase
MGEEFGASTPWQFFTSHPEPELAEATSAGRLREFERMGWDIAVVPNPQDPATFSNSKLNWAETRIGDHARLLDLYRKLAALRRGNPALTDGRFEAVGVDFSEKDRWLVLHRGAVRIAFNFAATAQTVPAAGVELLLVTDPGARREGQSVLLPGLSAAVVRS